MSAGRRCFTVLKKISICIHGGIGIGKSEAVREIAEQIAKEKKKEFIEWNKTTHEQKRELLVNPSNKFIFADYRIALKDQTDLTGLPASPLTTAIAGTRRLAARIQARRAATGDDVLFPEEALAAPLRRAQSAADGRRRSSTQQPLARHSVADLAAAAAAASACTLGRTPPRAPRR